MSSIFEELLENVIVDVGETKKSSMHVGKTSPRRRRDDGGLEDLADRHGIRIAYLY